MGEEIGENCYKKSVLSKTVSLKALWVDFAPSSSPWSLLGSMSRSSFLGPAPPALALPLLLLV